MYVADEAKQNAKNMPVDFAKSAGSQSRVLKMSGIKTKPFLIHCAGIISCISAKILDMKDTHYYYYCSNRLNHRIWPNPGPEATLCNSIVGVLPESDPYDIMNPRLAKALGYVEASNGLLIGPTTKTNIASGLCKPGDLKKLYSRLIEINQNSNSTKLLNTVKVKNDGELYG